MTNFAAYGHSLFISVDASVCSIKNRSCENSLIVVGGFNDVFCQDGGYSANL